MMSVTSTVAPCRMRSPWTDRRAVCEQPVITERQAVRSCWGAVVAGGLGAVKALLTPSYSTSRVDIILIIEHFTQPETYSCN